MPWLSRKGRYNSEFEGGISESGTLSLKAAPFEQPFEIYSMRAIVLFSGGLDSMLATHILQEQGIEVIGLNFLTPFHDATRMAKEAAAAAGIELVIHQTSDDYIELIAHPRWGYGKAVNPCIDCRIEMCRIAKILMNERDAGFVATGELSGQRPNSQMQHQLQLIERESGLEDYLLRPLSASILPPTAPERLGWVNRSKLFGFTGRGRAHLIALARKLGIQKIPQPSTGCFLCEKSYAPRLIDLFRYEPNPTDWDAELLNAGRQLRISPTLKVVLGRDRDHCDRLAELFERPDARAAILMIPESFNGPTALLVGQDVDETKLDNSKLGNLTRLGGALMLRYTNPEKYEAEKATAQLRFGNRREIVSISTDDEVQTYRVI